MQHPDVDRVDLYNVVILRSSTYPFVSFGSTTDDTATPLTQLIPSQVTPSQSPVQINRFDHQMNFVEEMPPLDPSIVSSSYASQHLHSIEQSGIENIQDPMAEVQNFSERITEHVRQNMHKTQYISNFLAMFDPINDHLARVEEHERRRIMPTNGEIHPSLRYY